MNKKMIIALSVFLLFILLFIGWYFFLLDPCASISDSSQQRDCYIDVAKTTGDITSCDINYYALQCIQEADSSHAADKETVTELCQKVTDTSKRNECITYVNTNY